jgi:methylated-DNA-[protein]-cysteine S-methyltransferase
MTKLPRLNQAATIKHLRSAFSNPSAAMLAHSQARVQRWFAKEAPLIRWGEMKSPLGGLFVAMSDRGICAVEFGSPESAFLGHLDRRARLARDPKAVHRTLEELTEYFFGKRAAFDLPLDLSALTPFQRGVLDVTCRIAPGQVWTYRRVAEEMGRPKSSRPVGQALAHNPVPIVIPCHRVIASDGSLGGYSGGAGLPAKRWLLRLEGAAL